MESVKYPKLIVVISFIIFLLVLFLLFATVRNAHLSLIDAQKGIGIAYFYISLIALICTIIFVVAFKAILSLQREISSIDEEIDVLNKESEKSITEEVEITEDIRNEIINIKPYIKAILPELTKDTNEESYTEEILKNIAREFEIVIGLVYLGNEKDQYHISGKYAYFSEEEPKPFKYGETLSGQVAKNKVVLNLQKLPEDYISVVSGLGSSIPKNLLIIPLMHQEKTIGILEIGAFKEFTKFQERLFTQLSPVIAEKLVKFVK